MVLHFFIPVCLNVFKAFSVCPNAFLYFPYVLMLFVFLVCLNAFCAFPVCLNAFLHFLYVLMPFLFRGGPYVFNAFLFRGDAGYRVAPNLPYVIMQFFGFPDPYVIMHFVNGRNRSCDGFPLK